MKKTLIDLTNKRFGRLTVQSIVPGKPPRRWLCLCDCGSTVEVVGYALRGGATKSCGCMQKEMARKKFRTHGYCNSPEYKSWSAAIQRCHNDQNPTYGHYGARGISVCDEWRNDFSAFIRDMGPRPKGTSLDRIDVNGNYEPGNCRWATARQQANNVRTNRTLTLEGCTRTVAEWARLLDIQPQTISQRIRRKYPVEIILATKSLRTSRRLERHA